MQSIGAIGILAHRTWGRAFGVVLGLLGTILGIGLLISSVDLNLGDQTIKGTFSDDPEALGLAILVFVSYAFIFLAMYAGRRHFRRKGVSRSTASRWHARRPPDLGGRPLSTAACEPLGEHHEMPGRIQGWRIVDTFVALIAAGGTGRWGQSRPPVDHAAHGS